jgi:hypothetical protein
MSRQISDKPYRIAGGGPGKLYPHINLPRELMSAVGKYYWVERGEKGRIILRPVEGGE